MFGIVVMVGISVKQGKGKFGVLTFGGASLRKKTVRPKPWAQKQEKMSGI